MTAQTKQMQGMNSSTDSDEEDTIICLSGNDGVGTSQQHEHYSRSAAPAMASVALQQPGASVPSSAGRMHAPAKPGNSGEDDKQLIIIDAAAAPAPAPVTRHVSVQQTAASQDGQTQLAALPPGMADADEALLAELMHQD